LIQLARTPDRKHPTRRTLLHCAAGNVLCDRDPDGKSKRRTERDLIFSFNAIFSELSPST
jgi:hypothetical protein